MSNQDREKTVILKSDGVLEQTVKVADPSWQQLIHVTIIILTVGLLVNSVYIPYVTSHSHQTSAEAVT